MSSIKKYILEQVARQALSPVEAKRLLAELAAASPSAQEATERVAIVGMACRFPLANDPEEFWQVLSDGVNCIRGFPLARRNDFRHILSNPHYTEFLIDNTIPPEGIDHAHAPAGYLDEIDKFDASFFGIPPTEATFMDPHQRAALELTWEAIEDAGYGGDALVGTNTGVYIGKEGTNYSLYRYCTESHPMQLTGSWESVMASRISYLFDFSGPCMLIDTACSAGLVSIHMAAQAILSGDCDQALAGGINLSITGEFSSGYQGSMAMDAVESRDSVIRTFDARANGTVWGEGVAMVMLKPLSRALADGDHIHAIIKGSAINNDGAASGLTAPDAESQEQVIVRAWEKAGVDPTTLGYVEAHGTGTVLGDPIEFKGLTAAFRRFTDKRQFCAIGSLKTNMGHLVAASGVASLFKVVKSIQHREMAPTINFGLPNPYINFLSSPLYVNDSVRAWESDGAPRRAALSSFGFSHTNCHMVVEEAPQRETAPSARPAHCFTLSAHSREVLLDYVARMRKRLHRDEWSLADVCYTSNIGRGHYPHRLAIIVDSRERLLEGLARSVALIAEGRGAARIAYGNHTLVSDKQKSLAPGELTAKARSLLSERAATALASSSGDAAALDEMARCYVEGAQVDWRRFHEGERRMSVSLPPYPLRRERVWAAPKISRVTTSEQRLHPLVERLAQRGEREDVYESIFSIDRQWVLSDHLIKGVSVVPGTTYLEMARYAARESFGWERLELCDVFFLVPMVVQPRERRRVRVRLHKADQPAHFSVESCSADGHDSDWQIHVEGAIAPLSGEAPAPRDLAQLKARADECIENYENETDTGVFQFGPHWDAIRSVWRIGGDALATLSLRPALTHEASVFQLHPSMLDNAVNLLSQSYGETYLPFSYKSFQMYAPMPAEIYSHIEYKTQKSSREAVAYDVHLTDADGRVVARILDYVTKRVASFAGLGGATATKEFLAPRWAEFASAGAQPRPSRLLVLGADPASAASVCAALSAEGVDAQALRLTDPGEDAVANADDVIADDAGIAAFSKRVASQAEGVIFLASGDVASALGDPLRFAAARRTGVDALFRLAKALVEAKARLPWGLAVVSAGAYACAPGERSDPLAAACAALGAVIGMEYPNLPCRLLDLARDGTLATADLLDAPPGRQLAARGDRLLVRELAPQVFADDGAHSVPALRVDGFHLVTGGLGGLGLATARHLAAQGARALVLVGRSPTAPREQWTALAGGEGPRAARYSALLALADAVPTLECVSCDVAAAAALETLLTGLRASHGPLRGVYHLAGVAGDGFLMRKDFARFDAVLKPKLDGLRNLYALTREDDLDAFVLFSSIVALTGGEGQGDYAAANAFMDALAWRAAAEGRRLLSVNWPGWKDVGMAADFAVDDAQSPFASLSADDAFARLQRALAQAANAGLVQTLPGQLQPVAIAPHLEQLPFQLSAELLRRIGGGGEARAADDEAADVAIRGKHEEELTATEIALARIYGAVLGLATVDLFTNFNDMGGNSIIATHLLKLIDRHFPGLVDISDVFSYASIDEMAAYIDGKRTPPEAPAAVAAGEDRWEKLIDGVGDDETALESLLADF